MNKQQAKIERLKSDKQYWSDRIRELRYGELLADNRVEKLQQQTLMTTAKQELSKVNRELAALGEE